MFQVVRCYSQNQEYLETGIFGNNSNGPGIYNTAAGEHGAMVFTVPSGGAWIKTWHMTIYSVTAGMKVRPAIWNCGNGTSMQSSDTLRKVGQEIVFPSTVSAIPTEYSANINSDGSAYFLPSGTYGIGYHSDSAFQVYADLRPGAVPTYYNGGDSYSDGTAATFGAASNTIKAPYIWTPFSQTGP